MNEPEQRADYMGPGGTRIRVDEFDLWEVIDCEFCEAVAGVECHTITGDRAPRSHKCRRVRL